LSSAEICKINFSKKLPTAEETDVVARTLALTLGASVVVPPPFEKMQPQFLRLSRHDVAMMQKADRSDHVRKLALSVKECYDRQYVPTQASAPGSLPNSSNNRPSTA